MKNVFTFACLSAAVLALGACGEKKEPARQDTAGGKILEHSINDDMLPYDTVRSQPPLAPKTTGNGGASQTAEQETEGAEPAPNEAGTESASGQSPDGTTPASE